MTAEDVERARGTDSARTNAAVGRQALSAGLGGIVSAVGGFALTIVIGRGLGAEGAGLFFQSVAVFAIFAAVCTFGADTGLLRAISKDVSSGVSPKEIASTIQAALAPVALAAVAVSALLYWKAGWIATTFLRDQPHSKSVEYVRLVLPFLALAAVSMVASQATRGFGQVLPYVLVQNVWLPIVRPVAVGIALAAGAGVLVVGATWSFALVPTAVLSMWFMGVEFRRSTTRLIPDAHLPTRSRGVIFREFWRFAGPRGAAAIVDIGLVWFDVLLVGALLSTAAAGVYASASRFVVTGTMVLQAMRLAIAPRMSALLSADRREGASALYGTATNWIIMTSWPAYMILAAFSPVVLQIFGKEFEAAGVALTILAVGMLANLATGNVGTVLLMSGKSQFVLINKCTALALNIGLNIVLVPAIGVPGAAIAWAAAILADNGLSAGEVRLLLHIRGYNRATTKLLAASIVLVAIPATASRVFLGSTLPALLAAVAVVCPLYALFVWHQRDHLNIMDLLPWTNSKTEPIN